MVTIKKSKLPEYKPHANRKHDWTNIRDEYVTGLIDRTEDGKELVTFPSYRELSEKYNVSPSMIESRGSKERWTDHRRAHQNSIAIARQKEHEKALAHKSVKFDEHSYDAAAVGIQIITNRLLEIAENQKTTADHAKILRDRYESGEELSYKDFMSLATFSKEIESLAKALQSFQEVGRKALGIKDDEVNNVTNITVSQTNVSEELRQKDPNRLGGILAVLRRDNTTINGLTNGKVEVQPLELTEGGIEEIQDAEIVEDDE